MERIFRALSDPSRRRLLDVLYRRDGRTVTQLDAALPKVTRFATMKHLRILEEAGLLTTRRVAQKKLHYLNPVPIRLIHDRWISKFAEPVIGTLSRLKSALEEDQMSTPKHVYEVIIRTTPEKLWNALTDPSETQKYFYGSRVESTWKPGEKIHYRMPDGSIAIEGKLVEVVPGRKFSQLCRFQWDEDVRTEPPLRMTWEITPMEGMCKLSVVHEDMGPETLKQLSGGIIYIVSGLKTLLETGEGLKVEVSS